VRRVQAIRLLVFIAPRNMSMVGLLRKRVVKYPDRNVAHAGTRRFSTGSRRGCARTRSRRGTLWTSSRAIRTSSRSVLRH
jgi:sugar lactone lactonase YvrE